jgi:hypothetical protein
MITLLKILAIAVIQALMVFVQIVTLYFLVKLFLKVVNPALGKRIFG